MTSGCGVGEQSSGSSHDRGRRASDLRSPSVSVRPAPVVRWSLARRCTRRSTRRRVGATEAASGATAGECSRSSERSDSPAACSRRQLHEVLHSLAVQRVDDRDEAPRAPRPRLARHARTRRRGRPKRAPAAELGTGLRQRRDVARARPASPSDRVARTRASARCPRSSYSTGFVPRPTPSIRSQVDLAASSPSPRRRSKSRRRRRGSVGQGLRRGGARPGFTDRPAAPGGAEAAVAGVSTRSRAAGTGALRRGPGGRGAAVVGRPLARRWPPSGQPRAHWLRWSRCSRASRLSLPSRDERPQRCRGATARRSQRRRRCATISPLPS